MDDRHFDALTRSLAGSDTRRTLLRRLGAFSIAGVPLLAAGDALAKRRKKKGRKKGKKGNTGKPTTCPTCPAGQQCVEGACVAACQPDCGGKACGAANGCGGTCNAGTCPDCQTCENGACVNAANGAPCTTDNRCLLTTCQAGVCTEVNHIVCDKPQNPCRKSTCNPATGFCDDSNQPVNYPCEMAEICMFIHGTCDGEGTCGSTPTNCGHLDRECCLSGPNQGQCSGGDGASCSSNADCCSGNCFTVLSQCISL